MQALGGEAGLSRPRPDSQFGWGWRRRWSTAGGQRRPRSRAGCAARADVPAGQPLDGPPATCLGARCGERVPVHLRGAPRAGRRPAEPLRRWSTARTDASSGAGRGGARPPRRSRPPPRRGRPALGVGRDRAGARAAGPDDGSLRRVATPAAALSRRGCVAREPGAWRCLPRACSRLRTRIGEVAPGWGSQTSRPAEKSFSAVSARTQPTSSSGSSTQRSTVPTGAGTWSATSTPGPGGAFGWPWPSRAWLSPRVAAGAVATAARPTATLTFTVAGGRPGGRSYADAAAVQGEGVAGGVLVPAATLIYSGPWTESS